MQITTNVTLGQFTTLGVGGPAEKFIEVKDPTQIGQALELAGQGTKWFLGYGANSLISDAGLPGTTLLLRQGSVSLQNQTIVADAGANWDDLVRLAIANNLWGVELMSGIPGGVGAAVVGNIAAYGQAVKDTLVYAEAINCATTELKKFTPDELEFDYRYSVFQKPKMSDWLILKAAFGLSPTLTKPLQYDSALQIGLELNRQTDNLTDLRDVILETRRRGGSLLDGSKTAGSFFRNPLVDKQKAEFITGFDETGKSKVILNRQNQIHGGNSARVSAALVLLAAGFKRGQAWGPVRLHPEHVLKIENTGGATAQQIYDVAHEIMDTVKNKLEINLQPEVRFLGEF